MKKITFLLAFLAFLGMQVYAQDRTITGKVTSSADGQTIVGATVFAKGFAGVGTVTDANGKYSIIVPTDVRTLVFSYIGMKQQEVQIGASNTINVVLEQDLLGIQEVVVTALGIKREAKALGYSVTEVKGEEFVESREVNFANAMTGKVAGVNVTNPATGAGGSSKITIRGNSSISASNEPLYIVDGVPIDNRQLGSAGMWGGMDWGDGVSSINPDDIENISILKGNSAAALYGSRASNGVVIITTKKGEARNGIGVEFNSNYTMDQFVNHTDFQTVYGHGNRGAAPTDETEALAYGLYAWGSEMDGSDVYQFDGEMRPYSDQGDNISEFYRTGSTFTNTLSLTGGNETHTFRFSASNLDNKSIVPNSGLNKKTFNFNINGRYADRLTLGAKIQYNNENVNNRARLSDSPGNANYSAFSLPRTININDLKGTTDKLGADEDGMELQFNDNVYVQNPWWAVYQYHTQDVRDRIIGSTMLRFDFTDWLYIQARGGLDWYTSKRTDYTPYGTAYQPRGQMWERELRQRETNLDLMLGFDKEFGDIGVNAFVGGNQMRRNYEQVGTGGSDFNIPFFHDVSNLANSSPIHSLSNTGINSLYGSAEVSFRNYLYLTGTARKDWFSTLDGKGILYPSVGLSFVLSDAVELPDAISYAKLRGSWAQVGGGAADPYQTSLTYQLVGQGHMGSALGRIAQGTIPNSALIPFTSTEIEAGFDARFLKNRLGIDFAFYKRNTTDDILNSQISETSGFGSASVNVGELESKGIELLVNGAPIAGDLVWNVSFNFSKNWNNVLSLAEGIEKMQVDESRTRNAYIQHWVDNPYSLIVGYKYKTTENGYRVYDDAGLPMRSDEQHALGSGIHDITMGLNNSFRYNNFRLSFLIDAKLGGSIYTATNAYAYTRGLHNNTLEGREDGLSFEGVANSSITEENPNGEVTTFTVAPEDVQDYYGRIAFNITEEFVQDASFVKLRSLTFGYSIPATKLKNTPFAGVDISLVGRNLMLLFSKVDNIDPESVYHTNNAQGLEMFGVPNTRTLGLNVNLKF